MKVLSIRQPYASFIIDGIKTVETRPYVTQYRGRIGIHSSLKWSATDEGVEHYLDSIRYEKRFQRYLYNRDAMPTGFIIGTVAIVDCVPAFDWCEARNKAASTYPEYAREWALGDLSSDRYAWVLKDPRLLQTPIRANGALRFWEYSALDGLGV